MKIHKNTLSVSQKGFALLAFFFVLLLAGTFFLLAIIPDSPNSIKTQSKTAQSLSAAKQALISYAASHYHRTNNAGVSMQGWHGYLPCPEGTNADPDNEGNQANNCDALRLNTMGRLPWKTLNIDPLKDSSGQCLWYAVTAAYKQNPKQLHNADSLGMFDIYAASGIKLNSNLPEDRIVAVIFAPGQSVGSQNRGNYDRDLPCGYARDQVQVSDFLENINGIDNANISTTQDQVDSFVGITTGEEFTTFNDQIITINRAEIFNAIINNQAAAFRTQMETLGQQLATCLINYSHANNDQLVTTFLASQTLNAAENACLATDYANCDATHNACLIADVLTDGECNQQRIECRSTARTNCISSVTINNYYRTPWPTLVDLDNPSTDDDYRNNIRYSDQNAAQIAANGYLGRFPFVVNDSDTAIATASGSPFTFTDIFQNCALQDGNNEFRRLWQDWKDQVFLVSAADFAPDTAATTTSPAACTSCPALSGAAERYAALIIIANTALAAPLQLRRDADIEPALQNALDLKGNINNYLEGSNAGNLGALSLGDYADYTGPVPNNDIIICVNEDMTLTTPAVCSP